MCADEDHPHSEAAAAVHARVRIHVGSGASRRGGERTAVVRERVSTQRETPRASSARGSLTSAQADSNCPRPFWLCSTSKVTFSPPRRLSNSSTPLRWKK